ncbi:MAG TPA: MFS transporter, partial [Pseudonocardiaceae bacterium]
GANSILGVAGWRWVFLVNVPIGLAALFVVAKVLNVPHSARSHRIDWWGALTLVVGLVPVLIIAEQGQQWGWGSPRALLLYAIGAVGVIAFIVTEKLMGENALIPLRLFRNKVFSVIILAGVVVGAAMFGAITLVPQYLQIVRGLSPTASGLYMLPLIMGLMLASVVSGQITSRTGRYKIFPVIGAVLIVGGSLLFTTVAADTPLWRPMLFMLVLGAGVGLSLQTLTLAAQNAGPMSDMGVSTASATFFRQIGGTLGVAVFLSILFSTVGGKISTTITSALRGGPFTQALSDPAVLHNPVNQPVLGILHGGGTGTLLQDSSFLQRIDPRLAAPFLQGFAHSVDLVFWVVAGVGVVAFLVTLFIKEIPLRTMSAVQAMAEGEGGGGAPALNGETTLDAELETLVMEPVGVGRHEAVGTPITGHVRRSDGAPAVDAVLTLINHGGQQVERGTSDADGGFELVAPLDGVYVLIASSAGHQPAASTLRAAGDPVTIDVVLTGTAHASGVVHANGGVVRSATVTLTDSQGEVVETAKTDADGRYTFAALLSGSYTLVVNANGYRPFATALAISDTADALSDVELSAAARLTGTTTGGQGQPVPDARVTLVDGNGHVVAMTATDESGAYTFGDLPEGDYTVIASGYPPVSSRHQIVAGEDGVHDVVLSHSDI